MRMRMRSRTRRRQWTLGKDPWVWPWLNTELFWRELINAVGDPKQTVVMTATPSAPACMAAARLNAQMIGFVPNARIKAVIMGDHRPSHHNGAASEQSPGRCFQVF